ncbi:hypothetical protein MJO29_013265 [Puccinia striiformis f. sp. tritici]|nr:hypothetical protein MJO29_013265 [Puccinia striiformis f. sp. tritici]
MYQAFGHLLEQYKEILMNCPLLNNHFKLKAQQISVSLQKTGLHPTGPVTAPTNVYFLEATLAGPYVKYSSNINFSIPENQPGMDMELFQIMDAFTHWTCNQSSGKYLVSDLQGVGPMLIDPQILDMDPHCWADGNTSSEGIQSFLKMHCCHPGNQVCEALGLGRVVDLEWAKPTPSFDHLLASRNNGVPDGSDFTSINEPQHHL